MRSEIECWGCGSPATSRLLSPGSGLPMGWRYTDVGGSDAPELLCEACAKAPRSFRHCKGCGRCPSSHFHSKSETVCMSCQARAYGNLEVLAVHYLARWWRLQCLITEAKRARFLAGVGMGW